MAGNDAELLSRALTTKLMRVCSTWPGLVIASCEDSTMAADPNRAPGSRRDDGEALASPAQSKRDNLTPCGDAVACGLHCALESWSLTLTARTGAWASQQPCE